MEEPLIEFVKQNTCLYDKSNRDYKNIQLRNKKFEELSRKLNIPAKNLKARWRTLRDNFNKELRLDAYDGRVSSSTKKQWKWLDHLMFLKDAKRSSSSKPNKYPRQKKTEFWFTDSADDASTIIDDSNTAQDVSLPDMKVDLCQLVDNFVEEQTSSMHSTPLRALEPEDAFIIDDSNDRSYTMTQDVLVQHHVTASPAQDALSQHHFKASPAQDVLAQNHVKGTSAVQIFFTGLAKQTEDANITPKQFAQLQMKLLKVFNKEIYNF